MAITSPCVVAIVYNSSGRLHPLTGKTFPNSKASGKPYEVFLPMIPETRLRCALSFAHSSECCSQFPHKYIRLFPGSKVTALFNLSQCTRFR